MRARSLKPAFFKNEILGTSDPLLSLLFEGLWCIADREGRLEDRPLRIRAEIFPYREGIDINGYLTELERLEFIRRYKVGNGCFIHITNFLKHQNPHKTERASDLPEPPVKTDSCSLTVKQPLDNGEITEAARLFTDSLNTDSLNKELCAEPTASAPSAPSRFGEFWASYPNKREKKKAADIWKRKRLDDKADAIIADVCTRITHDEQWTRGYIPHPPTYLTGERWNDAMESPRTKAEESLDDKRKRLGMKAKDGESWEAFNARVRAA